MLDAFLIHSSYTRVELPPAPPAIYAPAPATPKLGVHVAPAPTVPTTGLYVPGRGYWVVGNYTECVWPHKVALPRHGAWKWTCPWLHNNVYLLGHNPGQFTPLVNLRVGEVVYYNAQRYRIIWRQVVPISANQYWTAGETDAPALSIDMCAVPDGSYHLVFRAALDG